jgi:hypothetical protein
MKHLEQDPRLPKWANKALNSWPLLLDEDSTGTIVAVARDKEGWYSPGDVSLFYNGYFFMRLTYPFGIFLHIKPRLNTRIQFGFGWKLNGRFAITLRKQTDEQAATGTLGPNVGQAKGWERGTA